MEPSERDLEEAYVLVVSEIEVSFLVSVSFWVIRTVSVVLTLRKN